MERTRRTTRGISGMTMAMTTAIRPAREERDDAHGEQDRRDRHQAVHDAHDDAVEPADVAGDQADDEADGDADRRHRDADDQRHARAVDDAAVDVAAERVGAEAVHELHFRCRRRRGWRAPRPASCCGTPD